jgi:RTX calcium-binding nonapeptide repeat (4 copies)/FG-GAP-like repeat
MNTNLNQALSLVDRYLAQFAISSNFWPDFELAFGQNFDRLTAEQIRQSLSVGSFTRSIQVVQDQVLGLASGAFAAATNTVYLRESLVASGDLEHISEVIIEEYGHSIDSLVNKEETPGDEGAIFRLLVKGVKLTQAMLADLREEDDWAVISIDGQQLAVEMAVFNGTTGNDTLGGVVAGDNIGDDVFKPLTGANDVVNGGDGIDTLIIDYSTVIGSSMDPGSNLTYSTFPFTNGVYKTNTDFLAPVPNAQITFFSIEKFNITGTQDRDVINTSDGNDTIFGGAGYDYLNGGNGDNIINGGSGGDNVTADNGNDYLDGGAGDDTIEGGLGNDTLLGGGGSDYFYGEGGNDIYILENGVSSSGSIIYDADGNDDLHFSTPVTLNLATDFAKDVDKLVIDLNGDKLFDFANDLYIYNFFDAFGNAGNGFIETVQNLSGNDIINSIKNNLVVRNDFNNDKITDILWRNTDGHVGLWTMDGFGILTTKVVAPWFTDNNWQIAGTSDFNGDKKSDILWRKNDGSISVWLMDGSNILETKVVAPGFKDTNWQIAGTGDFNGDKKSDILLRNADGHVGLWTMDGTNVVATSIVAPWFTDNAWQIAGTGDFNGDKKSDILWRKGDGSVSVWLMDGTTVTNTYGTALTNDWKIEGIDDLDGNGISDILWRKDSGEIALLAYDGVSLNMSLIDSTAADGQIIGTGDFTRDGKADILWRNSSGAVSFWQMNGTNISSIGVVATADVGWQIAAPII